MAMDVAAEKATVEPREGMARRKERNAARQMVRIGAEKRGLTCVKKWGSPPSRAKPNIIRELEVMEKRPACQTQTMMRVIRAMAPRGPKISIRICVTGWPTVLSTVLGKDWMEKRRAMRRKKPKRAETPTEMRTPSGAFQAALLVSSLRCAEASKPVMVYCAIRMPQTATYAGDARTLQPGAGLSPVPS